MPAIGDIELMSTSHVNYPAVGNLDLEQPNEQAKNGGRAACCESRRVLPRRRWYLPIKFAVEYLVAVVLFLISIPIIFVAAVLIKATSKGPVFYLQKRLGKNGKTFRVIKLRTMIDKAESQTGAVWSTEDDPRITPVGKFLRDTHIDEFPQIINVLLGQMALVGPRPERPEIVEKLEWKIANYSERLNVRPGITGLSQMKLPPDTDLESVRRKQIFDLYYISNLGPWLDLQILASTLWLLIRAIWNGVFSLVALPSSSKVLANVETVLGPDSELLAQRSLPPR